MIFMSKKALNQQLKNQPSKWRKAKLLIPFILATLFAQPVLAKGKTELFQYPAEQVYAAALKVVATEYRVESVDKPSLTISFRTGMSMLSSKGQDVSLIVIPVSETECQVVVNTEKRGGQAITWGEGGKIQKKVLKLLAEELAKEAK